MKAILIIAVTTMIVLLVFMQLAQSVHLHQISVTAGNDRHYQRDRRLLDPSSKKVVRDNTASMTEKMTMV